MGGARKEFPEDLARRRRGLGGAASLSGPTSTRGPNATVVPTSPIPRKALKGRLSGLSRYAAGTVERARISPRPPGGRPGRGLVWGGRCLFFLVMRRAEC